MQTKRKNSEFLQAFGAVLRGHRERKGISQEELAFIAGVHRTYLSDVERGRRNFSFCVLGELAKALNVPASLLLAEMETHLIEATSKDSPNR